MIYPNRLAELMQRAGLSDPDLARLADTTKQQIFKLRRGERKMTRDWAERLAPFLDAKWPEVIGWLDEATRPAAEDPLLKAVGARVRWMRIYRGFSPAEGARRLAITPERLSAIETGSAEMTMREALTVGLKLQVSLEFVLQGRDAALPFEAGEHYREAVAQGSLDPPRTAKRKGNSGRQRKS